MFDPRRWTPEQRDAERRSYLHGVAPERVASDPEGRCAVLVYTDRQGQPAMAAFTGKAVKPAAWHYYRSAEERDRRVDDFIAGVQAHAAARAERRQARNAPHSLKVGDVLAASWGYEQTNIDYYEVVALYGKSTVGIRKIAAESKEDGFQQGTCTPAPGCYVGAEERHRVDAQHNAVRLNSFSTAFLQQPSIVDGKRVYSARRWTAYN